MQTTRLKNFPNTHINNTIGIFFMFVVSIDADWALEPLLRDTVDILNQYNIKATFFLTNPIDFSILNGHEIAIHPNFEGYSNQDEILKKTLDMLPSKKSKGSRSHKLYHNMALMSSYAKFGIQYDSNYVLPSYDEPKPFLFQQSNVLEIPIFFGDDTFFYSNSDFQLNKINLNDKGVKVFLFHPIHIFMNTNSMDYYKKIKPFYSDFSKLSENKETTSEGTRTLFLRFLEFIESNKIETKTLEEVNDNWRENNGIIIT